ncbi:MAG: phosphate acyltransferase PlsX [Planctomycetes bacterium]|nr:phosphate acyltransferase PlsX [Planctomycetota bacterium]
MIRIGIDAMGGDHAPRVVVEGAILAAQKFDDVLLKLVGPEERLRSLVLECGGDASRLEFADAPDVVEMHESPVEALRQKPRSSIRKLASLLKDGQCVAIFGAGNTGAMVAAATMYLGLLPGVKRAGIAVAIPVGQPPVILIDVGANVQCKPAHLVQYGIMASEFARRVYGVERPTVGLLNVGEEEEKGHALAKDAQELFRSAPISFAGNVEGRDIYRGTTNVVVCDGFVGNVVLKVSEGMWERVTEMFKHELAGRGGGAGAGAGAGAGSGAAALAQALAGLRARFDYNEYGGAPLLGVHGTVLIGHGRSDAKAVASAIRWTREMHRAQLNQAIVEAITAMPVDAGGGA